MSAAIAAPRRVDARTPVEALDAESRVLVPRTRLEHEEPRTAQRDQDVPSTEPDGLGSDQLARIRDSVISGLRAIDEEPQRTPRDVSLPPGVAMHRAIDPPTIPARDERSSDVFAPVGVGERAVLLDPEGPTPLDRPVLARVGERPTEIDRLREAPTVTHRIARATPVGRDDERSAAPERALPRERETDHERKLLASVIDSQRAYFTLRDQEPPRAAHIESLQRHLANSGRLDDRELVLAQHAREKLALRTAPADTRFEREDRVIALALHAQELEDRWRAQMSAHREHLVDELGALPDGKRAAVFADFETFGERDGANDSFFCRRELHKALKQEQELHKAYVYALALDKKARQQAAAHASTKITSDESSGSRRRR